MAEGCARRLQGAGRTHTGSSPANPTHPTHSPRELNGMLHAQAEAGPASSLLPNGPLTDQKDKYYTLISLDLVSMLLPKARRILRPVRMQDLPTSYSTWERINSGSHCRNYSHPSAAGDSAAAFHPASLSAVAAAQQYTRLYDAEFLPRRLRRIKIFSSRPPEELSTYFHEKLNKANSNPRSIIKLYRKYIRLEDEPDYGWLVRCFCQLGNVFGFNSFWAPRDKQRIHSLPSFKFLVYDLIERKAQIEPEMVPRLLYALTALEYRSYHLLPTLLEHIEANLHRWRVPTACNMALCLALLGVGDATGSNNAFGPIDGLSRDYSGVIARLALHVYDCLKLPLTLQEQMSLAAAAAEERGISPGAPLAPTLQPYLDECGCTPFDKMPLLTSASCATLPFAGLQAFEKALVMEACHVAGCLLSVLGFAPTLLHGSLFCLSECSGASDNNAQKPPPIAFFLESACQQASTESRSCNTLSEETLQHSGWLQHYLYKILYLADVEKPQSAEAIKRAVPFGLQKSLHLRWLDGILLNGQPQGSEDLQSDVFSCLSRLNCVSYLNCSLGRPDDEQHLFFASLLIRQRNLAIETDYLMPLGPGRPKPSGLVGCKQRLFSKFGVNVAVIHRCLWDRLSFEQKDIQMSRLLSHFSEVLQPPTPEAPRYSEDKGLRFMRHKTQKFESWPPDKIEI
ncbi:uncharacterized protein LOC34621075 [Cyclospora cayetanensis]|uniref:Uncharacterized protein LOC34621075 n=1 Tax=Cyclospora cayetanensis TaxID=88456 RepID=A0A6P6RXR3_9EIME|nr:uncharacterized protein LOC34621075 [Cyclospora cayetanensis]